MTMTWRPDLQWPTLAVRKRPRAAAALVLILLAATLAMIALLSPHLGYIRELTVGGGAIQDSDKLRDILLVPIAVAYQLALVAVLALAAVNLNKVGFLAFIVISALAIIAVFLNAGWGVLLILTLLAAMGISAYRTHAAQWQELSGHLLISSIAIALILNRGIGSGAYLSFASGLLTVSLLAVFAPRGVIAGLSIVGTVVVAGALLMSAPFLWLGLADARISVLDVVHALFAIAALSSGWRAAWRMHGHGDVVMPAAATALAILVLLAPQVPSHYLPTDDYHFGEMLLAAEALFHGGAWFTGFFSPHGLSDAGGAAVAWLLNDATGSGIAIAERLWLWYAAALLAWLLVHRIGPLPAVAIMIVLPIEQNEYLIQTKYLLLCLNLVLVTEAMAMRPAVLGGLFGTVVAFVGVFLNPGFGATAAVVGALTGSALQYRTGRRSLVAFLAGCGLSALALVAVFQDEVAGQLHFLAVSTATNLTIYGNGETSTIFKYPAHFTFALGPLLALAAAAGRIPVGAPMRAGAIMLAALVVPFAVYALIINSYASARLDATAMRAVGVSAGMLVLLPVYLSLTFGRGRNALRASLLSIALLIGGGPSMPSVRDNKPLLPPSPFQTSAPIARDIPELGSGHATPEQLAMIREVKRVTDALLLPGETFINLTNRSALYFYLNRRNPVPIASIYNAAPRAFQVAFLTAIKDDPPPLALVEINNINHDGLSVPLRSHHIYDFVLKHYKPFTQGPYIYAIRKDLAERLDQLPPVKPGFDFAVADYTDENWKNGIAIGANARHWSFTLPKSLAGKIGVGDELVFSDGVTRRVVRAENVKVLSEPTLALAGDGSMPATRFSVSKSDFLSGNLWARAFHRSELYRIPSAWGRSIDDLLGEMQPTDVTLRVKQLSNLEHAGVDPESFKVTGTDPFWTFVPSRAIRPADAGLLQFRIHCSYSNDRPKVQVFWRSSAESFSQSASFIFEASSEQNLVPLDASPYWSLLPDIAEIRVDIANPKSCSSVELRDLALFRRLPPR